MKLKLLNFSSVFISTNKEDNYVTLSVVFKKKWFETQYEFLTRVSEFKSDFEYNEKYSCIDLGWLDHRNKTRGVKIGFTAGPPHVFLETTTTSNKINIEDLLKENMQLVKENNTLLEQLINLS